MKELIKKVEQWAIDRNLHTASPQAQTLKVVEEFTEMLVADQHHFAGDVIDGIGDTYVTLIVLYKQLDMDFTEVYKKAKEYKGNNRRSAEALNWLVSGIAKQNRIIFTAGVIFILRTLEYYESEYQQTPEHCLSVAYNEIKDRKGRMIDGAFVKESDLKSSSFSQIEELARQYALTLSENGEGDDELFGRLKKYADEVDVNVTIYNLHLTTAEDSIGDDETLLESVRLTGKWGCAISVKGESK